MENRIVIQLDQTASQNQLLLRQFRERGQDPNLDCRFCLRARCNRKEEVPGKAVLV